MSIYSADKSARPRAGQSYHPRSTQRRKQRPRHNPFYDEAKMLADGLWEDAMELAEMFAPDAPADEEELSDADVWMVLENAATIMSPHFWDDPLALEDLIQLRKKFAPNMDDPKLHVRLQYVKKTTKSLPDPTITPANPHFEELQRRLKR